METLQAFRGLLQAFRKRCKRSAAAEGRGVRERQESPVEWWGLRVSGEAA